jgi:hypothetical protein
MGSLSDYAENRALNHFFVSSQSVGSTVYIGLCSADPTDAATGASCSEISNTNNYARKAITFGAPSARRVTQSAQVDFNTASGNWTAATHFVITDSATYGAGNVLGHGALASTITAVNGNTPRIASGQLWIQIDAVAGAGFTTYAANAILGHFFCATAYTSPSATLFCALCTVAPTDAVTTMADVTELAVSNNYARIATGSWAAPSGGATSNSAAITFATPSGAWATFVAAVICTAVSGTSANIIVWDASNITDQPAALNDTVQWPIGDFDVALS